MSVQIASHPGVPGHRSVDKILVRNIRIHLSECPLGKDI